MGIELSGECLSEYRIIGAYRGAIGDHYRMLRDHAKVTKGEVEHNHIQMYVAATKEFLNHWTASTSLTFGRR